MSLKSPFFSYLPASSVAPPWNSPCDWPVLVLPSGEDGTILCENAVVPQPQHYDDNQLNLNDVESPAGFNAVTQTTPAHLKNVCLFLLFLSSC